MLVFDGSKRTLNQQRLEVSASPGDTAAFLFPGALIILRGKAGPGAEVFSGFEDRHVCPDLVGDPHGNFIVGLLALNSPDIFRIGDDDMEVCFEDIEDGNPVFTGGFRFFL